MPEISCGASDPLCLISRRDRFDDLAISPPGWAQGTAVAPDCGRLPAGQEVAPLEQEDALAGGGPLVGEGLAAGTGADDDDVILIGRVLTLLESGGR